MMFCFLHCGSYLDWRLLVLAACICAAGSWITIRVFSRARACGDGSCRTAWVFLSGVPAGATIWTTHFVGMAAVWPDLAFAFDPTMMILSLFVAIVSTISGFAIAASRRIKITGEIGGAVVGFGICAMHYTGTAAVRAGTPIQLDPKIVALSILVGAVMGAVALNRVIRPITCYCKYGAASALTLAICGMHVIGWMAIQDVPDTIALPLQATSSSILIVAVASVGLLVIGTGLSSYLLDDRARAEAQTRFDHLAKHDTLTGLPNRVSFNERLELNLALAKSQHGRLAVLCMNLSRFKEINDFFGYHAGDRVLVEITQRISLAMGDGAFLARLGGDEFAVIQVSKAMPQDAMALAERISKTFESGFVVGAKPILVGINIGVSTFPDDGQDREQLMVNADVALERARANGTGSICLFEQAMDETVQRRRALSRDLGVAIENDELEVYYQVQAAVEGCAITGFEALLRWRHPALGMISPVEFIPLAEETGLIRPLGEWVLRTACRDAAAWPQPHKVAVNLSPLQLENDDVAMLVEEVLSQTGLEPQRLELEITESTLMRDVDRAVAILGRFKALGTSLAVDDFGTGYSSLSTLQLFPFDKIKLDRSFLGEGQTKTKHRAIVRAVISLARCLSMTVLAEGVETHDHLAFLREEGCDEVQGYLLSKPVPLSAIQHLVEASACPLPPRPVIQEPMLMAS